MMGAEIQLREPRNDVLAGGQVQQAQDLRDVIADGEMRKRELAADFLVRQAIHKEDENVALPYRQVRKPGRAIVSVGLRERMAPEIARADETHMQSGCFGQCCANSIQDIHILCFDSQMKHCPTTAGTQTLRSNGRSRNRRIPLTGPAGTISAELPEIFAGGRLDSAHDSKANAVPARGVSIDLPVAITRWPTAGVFYERLL